MTTMFFALMSAVSTTMIITLVADATKHERRPRRKHQMWVMKYLRRRECYGAYNSSIYDLLSLDVWRYVNSLPWLTRTVQQVHSKSNKWSLGFRPWPCLACECVPDWLIVSLHALCHTSLEQAQWHSPPSPSPSKYCLNVINLHGCIVDVDWPVVMCCCLVQYDH